MHLKKSIDRIGGNYLKQQQTRSNSQSVYSDKKAEQVS